MIHAAKCKFVSALALLSLSACASSIHQPPVARAQPPAAPSSPATSNYQVSGLASWYGGKFHGRKTASGERFNQNALTCAHRTLPFGTELKVTNISNGESVVVRVNDRGPHVKKRIIDLSRTAAKQLGMLQQGIAKVEIEQSFQDR